MEDQGDTSMAVKPIPDEYHSVQAYLIVAGALDAIDFYHRAFGATERLCMKDKSGRVSHAEIQLGDSCVMLADEHPEIDAHSPKRYGGSPVSLMLYVPDCDSVYRQALAAGAVSDREPADMPYGDRMAGVTDPFGFKWHLGTRIKNMTVEELQQLN